MSEPMGAGRLFDSLERLRKTIRSGLQRAAKLDEELREKTGKLERGTARELRALEERLREELTAADADHEARKARLERYFKRRSARIEQAAKNAREFRLKEVEAKAGKVINRVQRELLEINRERDEALKREIERQREFRRELEEERGALEQLIARSRSALRGYPSFARRLDHTLESTEVEVVSDRDQILKNVRASRERAERAVGRFSLHPLPQLFRFLPLWVFLLVSAVLHSFAVLFELSIGGEALTWERAGVSFAVSSAIAVVLFYLGKLMALGAARRLTVAVGEAWAATAVGAEEAEAEHRREQDRIQAEVEQRTTSHRERWNAADSEEATLRQSTETNLKTRHQAAVERAANWEKRSRQRCDEEHAAARRQVQERFEADKRALLSTGEAGRSGEEAQLAAEWRALTTDWDRETAAIYRDIEETKARHDEMFPKWDDALVQSWQPPDAFAGLAPIGRVGVNARQLCAGMDWNDRLVLPGPDEFTVPAMLAIPDEGSVVFETGDGGREAALAALNNLVLRLFSVAPPGRAVFTIIDPVDLGQNFAALMHLTDHEDRLINRRIWTQTDQIEQRLAELSEHIEKVTQLYLRNEYESITQYNRKAGRIAEPYHFLVIADFPNNFSELAVRRLMSIVASGPRCGVYTLMHRDPRRAAPEGFSAEDLRASSIQLRHDGARFHPGDKPPPGVTLKLAEPPDAALTTEFLRKVGRASVDSNRVEMPFADIAPDDNAMWSAETTAELQVAIGRTGATKLQQLALGRGTKQHVLIAGKTGSGKSTLLHVLITNLALWCPPDQVEFYLVDFKKGVEFKCYATHRLPHARVVAIESDREFGLSVLERLDEELRRRGDLFRQAGVQDLPGYKKSADARPMPRTLLIVDEFQELFVEDDRVAQNAALLLDRLVRQGRAFGIHVILGSQTLGGAYTLARTTLGQMVVRIALQCSEADAMLIMDDDNPAARLLSRPGEAIYNDTAGAIEGNSPFQVVWLSDEERDHWLGRVKDKAATIKVSAPVVFEGNAPAQVTENELLANLLASESIEPVPAAKGWLGAPNSIKGPTEVAFLRQSGNNLLVVGQREESALAMVGVSLLALAAQQPNNFARFVVVDSTTAGTAHRRFIEGVVAAIPHEVRLAGGGDVEATFAELDTELKRRLERGTAEGSASVYVFVNGVQRFRNLRYEEDFGFSGGGEESAAVDPGKVLNALLTEGPQLGMHVVCTCDTVNNVQRALGRKALGEFDLRVLFQMSANDSATLIDSPKAGDLGLHRALLHNAQAGSMEVFRPYALPDEGWITDAGAALRRLVAS